MSSHFANILKHAKLTCDPLNATTFKSNFTALKQLVDNLQAQDLPINPELFSRKHFNRPNKAPCTFVNIFECDSFTISVFILQSNYKMPCHDHPYMYGILKTISGKIRLQCYTEISAKNIEQNNILIRNKLTAVREEKPAKIVTTYCDSAVLTPNERNVHEISALDGPAAFFDILTPPYNSMRKCSFYAKVSSISEDDMDIQHDNDVGTEDFLLDENCLYLKRIPCPDHYYCDNSDDFS